MAAQVAGRRRHPPAGCAVGYSAVLRSRRAKSLRILICSLQTDNSELPMLACARRGGLFAMALAGFAKPALESRG